MTTKFQSRIFRFGFPEGDELKSFKEDITSLTEILDLSKLKNATEYISKITLSDEEERYEIYNKIIELGLITNSQKIYSFHRLINFFFKKFLDESTKEENIDFIIKDISKELNLNEKELSLINELLILIKGEAEKHGQKKQKERYKTGVLPYLKGVGTTVELRGVFNREIKIEEDIELYKKDIQIDKETPIIPIISVSLSVDSGTPDKFYFQASQEAVEKLIKNLKAALHKSKMLKEKFNNK